MERKEDKRFSTEKSALKATSEENLEKPEGPKPQRMETELWIFTGIFVLVSIAIGCIVWFMPAKIDKLVEDFDVGRRSAQFDEGTEF